ncbi:MAG: hypothetical protein ACRDFX_09495 [Chloroflexota bacterium]
MTWRAYIGIFKRRWAVIAVVIVLDLLISGYLLARASRHLAYQGCVTLYVADVSAPSLISAPQTTLDTAGQLLAGETAANFFGDDILDVAESQHVALFVTRRIQPQRLPNTSIGDINGSISGMRRDRTVNLCVSNPNSASALAAAGALGTAMTVDRGRFIGKAMAKRTFVSVISDPSSTKTSLRHDLTNFALQVIVGILVALGLALLWETMDPAPREG